MSKQTFEANSLDDALAKASAELGIATTDLDYEVEEKAADFWGLGDTTYVVTVTVPEAEPEEPEEVAEPEAAGPAEDSVTDEPATEADASPAEAQEAGDEADEDAAEDADADTADEGLPAFFTGAQEESSTEAESAPAAQKTEPAAAADRDDDGAADTSEDLPDYADPEPPADDSEMRAEANQILADIFEAMGFDCSSEVKIDDETMHVAITGDDIQYLLEGRGRGLAALELILNHSFRAYPQQDHKRVRVDAGDFRSQRDEELRDMAYQVAHRAKETGEPQETAELNPYERRIVHLTLADDSRVSTRSQGNGFLKAVSVIPSGGQRRD